MKDLKQPSYRFQGRESKQVISQNRNGSAQLVCIWLRATLIVFLLFFFVPPHSAAAGGLKDTVKDLYGGDGILLAPPTVGFSHAAHFSAASLGGLGSLSTALTSNLGLFAFNSTVTGFTFDIERGVPVRTTESLGPLLSERAQTLGARKLNVAFSYTRIEFKRFEGKRLNKLSLTFTHDDVNGDGKLGPPPVFLDFELDEIRVDLDLKIRQDVFGFFTTYGLTGFWDVGIVVPIVHSRVRAVAQATILDNSPTTDVHFFDTAPGSDQPRSTGGGDKTGIGDIILRTKYNFLRSSNGWPDLAIVGEVKLPTGDQDNLLGTGETNFKGLFVASRSFGPGAEVRWLTPHINLGYEVSTDSEQNNLRYVMGFDARVHPSLTIAVDSLGRWEPEGDGIGDHTVDLALGAKWEPLSFFLLNAGVQVPLNKNQGIRPNLIWTLGLEYTF